MELDPFNATLRSNSSLCWIRFGNGTQALKDAQACRMMRPGWAKGCHREGTALMLLKVRCDGFLDGSCVLFVWENRFDASRQVMLFSVATESYLMQLIDFGLE